MELQGCAASHPLLAVLNLVFTKDCGLELGIYQVDGKWQNDKFHLLQLAQVSGSEGKKC